MIKIDTEQHQYLSTHFIEYAQQVPHPESGITVSICSDLTLAQLAQRKVPFIRTIHKGNIYVSNLALREATPAQLVAYDRTTPVDNKYSPFNLRIDGKSYPVASYQKDQASPFFKPAFNGQMRKLPEELQGVTSPAQLHMDSLRMLYPDSVTYSEWLLQHHQPLVKMVDAIAQEPVRLFDRKTDTNGVIKDHYGNNDNASTRVLKTAEALAKAVQDGDPTPQPDLSITTNEFNVFSLIALEALKPENQLDVNGKKLAYVLHAAGDSMGEYVGGYNQVLNSMYQSVRTHAPELDLPEHVFFGIVPSADLKVALPESQKEPLDKLGQLVVERFQLRNDAKNDQLDEHLQELARRKALEVEKELIAIARNPDLAFDFGGNYSPTALSHYDCLRQGKIRVPEAFLDQPFSSLREYNRYLHTVAPRKKK